MSDVYQQIICKTMFFETSPWTAETSLVTHKLFFFKLPVIPTYFTSHLTYDIICRLWHLLDICGNDE